MIKITNNRIKVFVVLLYNDSYVIDLPFSYDG